MYEKELIQTLIKEGTLQGMVDILEIGRRERRDLNLRCHGGWGDVLDATSTDRRADSAGTAPPKLVLDIPRTIRSIRPAGQQ